MPAGSVHTGECEKKGDAMNTKELLFASIVLLIIFSFCSPLYCQSKNDVVSGMTCGGRVVSVDSQKSQIVVKSSNIMTFFMNPNSRIINDDGFGIELSDVEVGKYVTVGYYDDDSGKHIMRVMEVEYNR